MLSNGMQTIHEQRQKIKNGLLAGMLPRALRSLAWEQRMVEATQRANHKATFGEGVDMPDEGDDTVNVDSPSVVNNYYEKSPDASRPSAMGTMAKLAIGAGLISTGAGAGVGVPMLLDALKDGKEVIDQKQDPIDVPKYFLGLGKSE